MHSREVALAVFCAVVAVILAHVSAHKPAPKASATVPATDILTYVPPPQASTDDRAMLSSLKTNPAKNVHYF